MKRVGLLILLLLLLLVDLAENGYLGKVTVCLPHPSVKTYVASYNKYPVSEQGYLGHELASPNFLENPLHGDARSVSFLFVPPTLRIMHCCHLSSAGGLPML
jgi:hypothetical protein